MKKTPPNSKILKHSRNNMKYHAENGLRKKS